MASTFPLVCRLQVPSTSNFVEDLTSTLAGDVAVLLAALELLPQPTTLAEQTFWQEERERLEKLQVRDSSASSSTHDD